MQQDVYERQGFGNRVGLGQRPALLVVDFVNGFADPALLGGGNIPDAIAQTTRLLAVARRNAWKIAHSRIVFAEDAADANPFCAKVPKLASLTDSHHASRIVDALAPFEGELVVSKSVPSAFFGTMLAPWLLQHGVDSLVIAGCTTSGCVRASAVDAMSWGLRVTVARDCVGDRAVAPHEANLFDIAQKYGDVVDLAALVESAGGSR